MSSFAVKIEKIEKVLPHPNADRLDVVQVLGWNCVTAKGSFKEGDLCLYIPIDSVLPVEVETKIFGPDSKVRLNNSRVRTIKLRGAISQGMALQPSVVGLEKYNIGDDFTKKLGISKYEPPVSLSPQSGVSQASTKQVNPHFRKYTSIENAKNHPKTFSETEVVCVTEKIHGSNWRAGYVPFCASTLWNKLKKFLGLAPKYEFVLGSHNVQLQNKFLYKGYYDKNIYAEMVAKYNIKNLLKPGEVLYGEVYGDGVQKNYKYGCKAGERKLVIFDVMVDGKYLDILAAKKFCESRGLPFVPVLYTGKFDLEKIKALTVGDSVLAPDQKIREGVVVKPLLEETTYIGRKVLKFISDAYLLRDDNTDFH